MSPHDALVQLRRTASLRVLLLACLASTAAATPQSSNDVLFAFDTYPRLHVLDLVTGASQSSHVIPGLGSELVAATFAEGRLWAFRRLQTGSSPLMAIHPGDAEPTLVGATGVVWWNAGIEVHPTTGILYGVDGASLYTLDATTGQATLVASIHSSSGYYCAQVLAM